MFVNFRIICIILFFTQFILIISNPADITRLICCSPTESKSLAHVFFGGNCSLFGCQGRGGRKENVALYASP